MYLAIKTCSADCMKLYAPKFTRRCKNVISLVNKVIGAGMYDTGWGILWAKVPGPFGGPENMITFGMPRSSETKTAQKEKLS